MLHFLILINFGVGFLEGAVTRLPEKMLNTRLDGSNPLNIDSTSLLDCVRNCDMITECLSLNYSKKTRKCQLFNKTANDSIPLIYSTGEIHVEIVEWTQMQSSQCSSKPCVDHALCLPKSNSYVCSYPTSINTGQTSNSNAISSEHTPTTQGTDTATNESGTAGSQTEGSLPITTVSLLPDGLTSTSEGTTTEDGSQSEGSNPITTDTPAGTSTQGTGTSTEGGSQSEESISLTTDVQLGTTTTQGIGTTTEGVCSTFVMNDLPATQISASSVKSNTSLLSDFFAPRWARLNSVRNGTIHGGGWLAETNDQSQYIEVRFNQRSRVYALFLQGYDGIEAWVTEFKILYSTDCDNFSYKLNILGTHEVFAGTYSSDDTRLNVFMPPIEALCFRVNPVSWHNYIGLRLDIMACEVSGGQ